MSPSIECTFDQFKRMAKEFHEALPTARPEEAEAGMKALGLAYLGCTYPEGSRGDNERTIQAPIVLRIASREYIEYELKLAAAKARNKR